MSQPLTSSDSYFKPLTRYGKYPLVREWLKVAKLTLDLGPTSAKVPHPAAWSSINGTACFNTFFWAKWSASRPARLSLMFPLFLSRKISEPSWLEKLPHS